MPTTALSLDDSDFMLSWAREQVREPMRAWTERKIKGRPVPSVEKHGVDPFEFMAEYLVWKATPPAWRPATWPLGEDQFCLAYGMPITAIMWFRRMVGFDRLLKRARRFQPGTHERIADARNTAHQMVLRQPTLDPRFADARWLAETAKIEGLHTSSPMVQIQNTQMSVPVFSGKDAEAAITDALDYFKGRGGMLPQGAHTLSTEGAVHGRVDPVRSPAMARGEGSSPRGTHRLHAVQPDQE